MQFYRQLRSHPFTRLLISLVSGIIAGIYCHPDIYLTGFILLILTTVAFLTHEFNRSYRLRWVFGIVISSFLFLTGLMTVNLHDAKNETARQLSGRRLTFEAVVKGDLIRQRKTVRTTILVKKIHGDTIMTGRIKAVAYFSKSRMTEELQTGDVLRVCAVLNEIGEPRNPYEFNYKRWMQRRGFVLTTYLSGDCWQKVGTGKGLRTYLSELRHKITGIYKESGIGNDELAVLSALTLGIRESLPAEIERSFAVSGAMHVLAVSGLHVGIVFLILNVILSFARKFRYGRYIRLVVIVLFLWFFAFLTGMRPSVVRAVFMFSVIQAGRSLKKPPDIYNTICLSAFCLLLADPYQLFDVGFQLSYLAVTGVVFFQPKIYRLVYFRNPIIDRIWQLFTVSVAAQLITAPLTIYYFHYFPVYFWLTNLFVILLTGLILYAAVLQISVFLVHLPYLFTGKILNFFLRLLNGLTCQIHGLPYSLIDNINISLYETILCYAFVISVTIYILKRNKKALICSLIVILMMSVYGTVFRYKTETQERLVVFDISSHSLVGLVSGREIVFLSDIPGFPVCDDSFHVKNYLLKRGIGKISHVSSISELPDTDSHAGLSIEHAGVNIIFETVSFRGILLKDLSVFQRRSAEKLKLDCIILSQNADVTLEQLKTRFLFKKVILDSSNRYYYRKKWLNMDHTDEITVHSVAEHKAFEMKTGCKINKKSTESPRLFVRL
ncbi:MAG: ComEC/Rec2 family competence protein [Bacteroidales bacterium]|nr:ComEC/Rec2 family competence protein [Bacteroidales bacterium]